MRTKLVVILAALLCLYLIACKSETPAEHPPPDNRSRAEKSEVTDEWIAELSTELGPHQLESVQAYVHAAHPEWSIRGMATALERDAFHYLSLDLTRGAEAKTVNLVSRVFVREDKSSYWKTEPLNAELEHIAAVLFTLRGKDE